MRLAVVAGAGPLGVLSEDPARTAVLTDFDGTLAAIVPDPERAEPVAGAPEVLQALAERFAVVAVVSGRPVTFLARHLATAAPSVRLYGGYGAQWIENGVVQVEEAVQAWADKARTILAAARAEAPLGVGIEDKGWAVTLHWRPAPEAGEWAEGFATRWSAATGMVLQPGRMAVEFRPPVACDKGTVVERLASGCHAACFAGDDAGDLAAFAALDRLEASGVRTVRVAVAAVESPPQLVAAADVVVDGPRAALAFLRRLLD